MLLSKFNNEVLVNGPKAVLPQNLPPSWLKVLEKSADDFLDFFFTEESCQDKVPPDDPLLCSCVYELLRHQYGPEKKIASDDLMEQTVLYALSILMESVNRLKSIPFEPPTLATIFSTDRLIAFKKAHPEFIRALHESCMIYPHDLNVIQKIKKRISGAINGA